MNKLNITIKYRGKCDPCGGVDCPEPEVCQLDSDRKPFCKCGDTCPIEFNPICGSDGKTYSNECVLRQEVCRTRKPLRVIYRGRCSSGKNPCTGIRCDFGEECLIDKYGIAACACPPECQPVMRPICSKCGQTFSSECELKRRACLTHTKLELAHIGVCGGKSPCADYECTFGAICVERFNSPSCQCPTCSAEFNPVCGSDGITYENECKLKLETCKHHRRIDILYSGPCNGCEKKTCEFYGVCETEFSTDGRCVCPKTCDDDRLNEGPVCGTDGVTYNSECQLRALACEAKQYVVVTYKGDCDLCRNLKCKFGARCEAGECICPTNCEGANEEPVCGSNMVTFSNECELQKNACVLSSPLPTLSVLFYGNCSEKFPVTGPFTTQSTSEALRSTPGTASTNDISKNLLGSGTISVQREACRDIRCNFEATCELGPDHFPRCTCQFDCDNAVLGSIPSPVCGSDNRMYTSICEMKREGCQQQKELRLRPLDLCQGMEVKPCNGEKPIIEPTTGKAIDCGSGPNRQDCPSGSYCHQTVTVSRCCRKDNSARQESCETTWFGCCPDGKTVAQGTNNTGCPSMCGCNRLGSYSSTCNSESQCNCKPGVGGLKCDRCLPGFWGLPKIAVGQSGCIPCGCSTFGSVRDDCEQMTGRCVCKSGVQGHKCTVCTNHNKILTPNGCVSADVTTVPPTSCAALTCHSAAVCIERKGRAICDCQTNCDEDIGENIVCGSDGQTYASICELRRVSCQLQKDIVTQAFGTCKEDLFTGTDWPMRQYTPLHFTQPDESYSPLYKSTRHLLVDRRYYYEKGGSSHSNVATADSHNFDSDGNPSAENELSIEGSGSFFTQGGNYAAAYRPTPATVRVITPLLGDFCNENLDCVIKNSSCLDEICQCVHGYSESSDRQECLAYGDLPEEMSACSSSPCQLGSTCVDLPSSTFTCLCSNNTTGLLCDSHLTNKQFQIPSFDGHSYARLKCLKAYHKLSIEIEFKTYSESGILLYNQQKANGQGDFISLAIVNRFMEFKYNLGNGVVMIRSLEKVELKKFHRVVVKRYHKDGVLKLDDGEDIAGQSKGSLRALDLSEDAYIGFIPSNHTKIFENIGTSNGLQGCIRKLKIGRRVVELQDNIDDLVIKTENIHECGENPCRSVPCQNGGICHPIDAELYRCECVASYSGNFCETMVNPCLSKPCKAGSSCQSLHSGKFFCRCPPGRKGELCELIDIRLELSSPEFFGPSYIALPRLANIGREFSIEVVFLSRSSTGLLLYSGQMKNGRGDFISLNIVNGKVQFRFNLGSGIANITSHETITLDVWHWVRIFRDGRHGFLQLDNSSIVKGYSGAPLTELNLELPLYIGSVLSWQETHRLSGVSKGFNGAIQRIILNGHPLPISRKFPECSFEIVNSSGCAFELGTYDGLPCPLSKETCVNNGLCIPNQNNYICQCHSSYEGAHCEIAKEENSSIKFSGTTFLQYRNRGYRRTNTTNSANEPSYMNEYDDDETVTEEDLNMDYNGEEEYDFDDSSYSNLLRRKNERGNKYEFRLRTSSSNGLLLWRSKHRSITEDYFVVAIVDGYPEMSYNLGKQQVFWAIRSTTKINDGEWHTLEVRRRKKIGLISVDGETPIKGISNNGALTLSTSAKLWIGGMPSLPPGLPSSYYMGYEGCIKYIIVSSKPLNLLRPNSSNKLQFCHDNEI